MLKQKFLLSYGSKIFSQVLTVGVTIVVARVAGPKVLGTVAFGQAFVSLWLFLADLGLTTAHVKIVSEGKNEGDANTTFGVLKTALNVLYALLFLGGFWVSIRFLGVKYESLEHRAVILIWLATVVLLEFAKIPTTTFMGHTHQARQDVPDIGQNAFQQALRLIAVLAGMAAVGLSLCSLASAAAVLPVYYWLFRPYPKGRFRWDLVKRYGEIALPVLVIIVANNAMTYSDRVLLQYVGGSQSVGYYVAGYRVGGFILMVGTAMGNLFFPVFSQAFAQDRHQDALDKLDRYERFCHVFILPGILFATIFSPAIVGIVLGKEYGPSVPILSMVTMATFICITNMPYGNILVAKGKFKLGAAISLVNLGLYVPIAVLLTSRRGCGLMGLGMAIALTVSHLFLGVSYRYFAKKLMPDIRVLKYVPHLLFGGAAAAVGWFLYGRWVAGQSWWVLVLLAVAFFPAIFGTMTVLGFARRRDWSELISILDYRMLWQYVHGELVKGRGLPKGGSRPSRGPT